MAGYYVQCKCGAYCDEEPCERCQRKRANMTTENKVNGPAKPATWDDIVMLGQHSPAVAAFLQMLQAGDLKSREEMLASLCVWLVHAEASARIKLLEAIELNPVSYFVRKPT